MVTCVLLNTAPADVYTQMAVDDFFVNSQPADTCFLRFFNWKPAAAATFGYAQFESSVKKQLSAEGIKEYTRRPTGGGVVLHKGDLTFSLIFNNSKAENPRVIYSSLHGFIKEELLKIKTHVAVYDSKSDYRPAHNGIASNCFTNPVSDDLLGADGIKVLGGAIRRFGQRVLYQGSFQLAGSRGNAQYTAAIKAAVLKYLGAGAFIQRSLDTAEELQIEQLAKSRYNTPQWIEKF